MKKFATILILLILLDSTVLSAFASDNKYISLQDAINTVNGMSSSLKILDDKIKLAESKYEAALRNRDSASSKYWSSSNERLNNAKTEFVLPLQKKSELDELKYKYHDTKETLRLEVIASYHEILIKQRQITTQQQKVERVKYEYEIKKKYEDIGKITLSELIPYEIAVEQALTLLETLQNELYGLYFGFNQKLGYNMDQKLVLKNETITVNEYIVDDIDKLAADVVAGSYSINKIINDKAIKEKERWVYIGYSYGATPDEIETLDRDILSLDYRISDEKLNVEYKVRSDYNNLLNLFDEIAIKKLVYDRTIKLSDIEKTKYEYGISNLIDYQKVQGDSDIAFDEYNKACLKYYIEVMKFKKYIEPYRAE